MTQVRASHEGARFDSDVFLIEEGVLPAEVVEAADVMITRVEPEIYVPPLPGSAVEIAVGAARDSALYFDQMEQRLVIGLGRDDRPLFANFEFIDGTRGAHVNISGISGVATKTTYATFLLYSMFNSGILGAEAANTKALIFNVKGEDLLFLDHANNRLSDADRERYAAMGLPAGPFDSVAVYAPPRRGDPNAGPDVATRNLGVDTYYWTLEEFVHAGAPALRLRRAGGRAPPVHDAHPLGDRQARCATASPTATTVPGRSRTLCCAPTASSSTSSSTGSKTRSGHRRPPPAAPSTRSSGACCRRSAPSGT